MQQKIVEVKSISRLHEFYGCAKPRHPLISVIDFGEIDRSTMRADIFEYAYRMDLYAIFCKKHHGPLKYGKRYYDFNEGSLMFLAPGQLITPEAESQVETGWGLFFHPEMLNGSSLSGRIDGYSFFHYDVNEALHVSDQEKSILNGCLANIEREYTNNLDAHSHDLIQFNIELLLGYCQRFYGRQFLTREKSSRDIVQRFELLLKSYFQNEKPLQRGIPDVRYFATELCLSANYLSDLLKRHTGKTTQEHIHFQLVDKAKVMLWDSDRPVSEIAYELGFEHPSHFNKLFKSKVGKSPGAFRGAD
ncbi:transcriptional regulator [Pedobacter sp. BAL39]|uniref:helix-turn-helix domain-containing protein n=1 Tax=Pedobacter sp. BAL39 TaxID=391596 RepID=UPI000155B24C|nr:helix-turn-helix domain-containing protein [Pedobacter sp. BAL39]EDM34631.1 transcriptional regulator [Pedobacter sp. BAL39]